MIKNDTHISNRKELQSIFNNVPSAITLEDSKGNILNANNTAAEIFNLKSNNDLVGKNIKSIFNKYKILDINGAELKFKDKPAVRSLNGLQNGEATLTFIDKKNGDKKYLLIKAIPVGVEGNKTKNVIKSYKDITETLEEEKQRDFFVGVLSHELKNPIASIKAYAQLLKRKILNKKDKTYVYAENIESQTDRVANIVNDIFDVNRFTTGKFILNRRKINLDKTIQRTIANFLLTTQNRIIIQKGGTDLEMMLDEDRFVQVLVNLLSNAIKYSSPKKQVEVKTWNKDNYVNISIKDYGIGIPQKYQSEVFKIFRVAPAGNLNKKHGIGMGLALSNSIIKAHKGQIVVKSKVRQGTTFIIKLPLN